MQYNYLGGGQESGRSSVGQALGQTYSPLENMQRMSQEFAKEGLSNAGAMRRQMVSSGAQAAESQMARNEQRRAAQDEKKAQHRQNIAYLGELITEQEALAEAASASNDPEQIRRIPELLKNVNRMKGVLKAGVNYDTLSAMLQRNKDTESLEALTASARGGLRSKAQPKEEGKQPAEAKPKEQPKKEETRLKASARKTIKI
jgi:hypothetical protein